MPLLSSKSGSDGGEFSQESDACIGRAFTESDYYKDSISQANNVLLDLVFQHYKIHFYNTNKICCPFHNEKSGSFVFYKETNSFYCFGCAAGSRPVDFVSRFDKISKEQAAKKILSIFDGIAEEPEFYENSVEKLETMLDFSNYVYEFKKTYNTIESIKFIENIEKSFDDLLENNSLENEALKTVFKLLKEVVKKYNA